MSYPDSSPVITVGATLFRTLPSASRNASRRVATCRSRTFSSSPIRRSTSTAGPRMSIGYPPPRTAAAFSATVTAKPYWFSQYASAGPAMLAPEISTLPLMVLPLSPAGDRCLP